MALAFIHNRPHYFGEMMANLLFWLGPDRIIYGTDFPIWYPHWQLDDFMEFKMPEDIKEKYGVDLTEEIKQKIIGGNIARLYGIDIDSKLKSLENDEIAQRKPEAIIDFVGEGGAIEDGIAMLKQAGSYFNIGYGGNLNIPTIDIISNEINFIGNLVGTYNDLDELMVLTAQGKVKLHTAIYSLDAAIDAIHDLDGGKLRGRGILVP